MSPDRLWYIGLGILMSITTLGWLFPNKRRKMFFLVAEVFYYITCLSFILVEHPIYPVFFKMAGLILIVLLLIDLRLIYLVITGNIPKKIQNRISIKFLMAIFGKDKE